VLCWGLVTTEEVKFSRTRNCEIGQTWRGVARAKRGHLNSTCTRLQSALASAGHHLRWIYKQWTPFGTLDYHSWVRLFALPVGVVMPCGLMESGLWYRKGRHESKFEKSKHFFFQLIAWVELFTILQVASRHTKTVICFTSIIIMWLEGMYLSLAVAVNACKIYIRQKRITSSLPYRAQSSILNQRASQSRLTLAERSPLVYMYHPNHHTPRACSKLTIKRQEKKKKAQHGSEVRRQACVRLLIACTGY